MSRGLEEGDGAVSSSKEIGLNCLNKEKWAAQSTTGVQQGFILDLISVTLPAKKDRNISQSSFPITRMWRGRVHQSTDCAKQNSSIFIITVNQVGKIGRTCLFHFLI